METIWLEFEGNEMMVTDFAIFLELLNVNNMKYASYYGDDNTVIMEVKGNITDDFGKKLSQFMYNYSIFWFDEEPEISDIDLIEEMSNMD